MQLDASIEPGTILSLLVLLAAVVVLFRAGRSSRAARSQAARSSDAVLRAGVDGCAWKVRVLGVTGREYRLRLSGTSVRIRRGEVLLAMRPQPAESTATDADANPTPVPPGRVLAVTVVLSLWWMAAKLPDTIAAQAAPPIASIAVRPGASRLPLDGTVRLTALGRDSANRTAPLAARTVTWSSSDPGVASVDAGSGAVIATGAGAATITARTGNLTATAQVTVVAWKTVTAGNGFGCGITTDGRAHCWGEAVFGSLGNGKQTGSSRPVPVAGGLRWTAVSGGFDYSCGVAAGGTAASGLPVQVSVPAKAPQRELPVAFASVSAGQNLSCGATTAGRAYCWGRNDRGQLGAGRTTDAPPPSGELGEPQLQRLLRVQQSVRARLGERAGEIERKYQELLAKDSAAVTDVPELISAYRDLAAAYVDAKRAQVDALNDTGFSLEEYRWVRTRAYAALGVPMMDFDVSRIADDIQSGRTAAPPPATMQLGPAGTPATLKLVEPHRKALEANAPLAHFGL